MSDHHAKKPKADQASAGTHELLRYDAMCRAIDAAYEIDEVKAIHDQAAMLQAAARVAKNVDAETRAYEIRMRAARKAGAISKKIEKTPGNQYSKSASPEKPEKQKVLKDAGISTQQASEWERLAAVPAKEFETRLIGSKAPSARGIIYDYVHLHGNDKPTVPGEMLTGNDLANSLLEGAIRDIERLENKYSHIELVKDTLATARWTIAARLIPVHKKSKGFHVVK